MKRILYVLPIIIVLVFIGCGKNIEVPSAEEKEKNYQIAIDLYNNKDYENSLQIFEELGDYKEASEYKSIIEKIRENQRNDYAEGMSCFNVGDYENAVKYFSKSLGYMDSQEYLNKSSDALFTKAKTHYGAFEYEEALKVLNEIPDGCDVFENAELLKKTIKEKTTIINNSLNISANVINDYSNIADYYGLYQGESTIEDISGKEELIKYLESKGKSLNDTSFDYQTEPEPFAIAIYDDEEISPASWDLIAYMGNYFDYLRVNNRTFITYTDFDNGQYANGDLLPNNSGHFYLMVSDVDKNGIIAEDFLNIEEEFGCYTFEMMGDVNDNSISGDFTVTLYYGDMIIPYRQKIHFTAVKQED